VTTQVFGPTFGFYADLPIPLVKLGVDLRGALLNGGGYRHYSGAGGPRVEVDLPVIGLKPYAEGLFGVGSYTTSASGGSTLHIDLEGVVGVDHKLMPLLDWRILEFSYTDYYGGSLPTKALSTGLVLRLP
jgi:hypothetical protein